MNWQFLLVLILIFLSIILYSIHFAIYSNAQYIFNSVLARIAFVPIQVFLVALVLNRLLTYNEKRTRLEKINMIIGVFFTEVGTDLLSHFSSHDPQKEKMSAELNFNGEWDDAKFNQLKTSLKNYNFTV